MPRSALRTRLAPAGHRHQVRDAFCFRRSVLQDSIHSDLDDETRTLKGSEVVPRSPLSTFEYLAILSLSLSRGASPLKTVQTPRRFQPSNPELVQSRKTIPGFVTFLLKLTLFLMLKPRYAPSHSPYVSSAKPHHYRRHAISKRRPVFYTTGWPTSTSRHVSQFTTSSAATSAPSFATSPPSAHTTNSLVRALENPWGRFGHKRISIPPLPTPSYGSSQAPTHQLKAHSASPPRTRLSAHRIIISTGSFIMLRTLFQIGLGNGKSGYAPEGMEWAKPSGMFPTVFKVGELIKEQAVRWAQDEGQAHAVNRGLELQPPTPLSKPSRGTADDVNSDTPTTPFDPARTTSSKA
ncbi:hypothetical protein FS837_001478 [Tulasnella sp. UAMH 9824]|nr:hypothetical protein FS837_001478 [Tulasnella sp. UAMH 9824]